MKRIGLIAVGAALLAGCLTGTADTPPLFGGHRANEGARRGVAVMADESQTNREAARALAAPLAGECFAESLGAVGSLDEGLAAARARGIERLVLCRVIEYDPYDPARLVVRVSPHEVGAASPTRSEAVMTLGWKTGAAAAKRTGRYHRFARTIHVDLGTGGWIARYAAERGRGDSPADLLEAEILLRDPGRFFPFIADFIASEALAAEAEAQMDSPKTANSAAPAPAHGVEGAPRALGELDGLR